MSDRPPHDPWDLRRLGDEDFVSEPLQSGRARRDQDDDEELFSTPEDAGAGSSTGRRLRPDERRADIEEKDADHGRRHAEEVAAEGKEGHGDRKDQRAGGPPGGPRFVAVLRPGEEEEDAAEGRHEASGEHQRGKVDLHDASKRSGVPEAPIMDQHFSRPVIESPPFVAVAISER